MNHIGIIAEYNPFHNGHLYQIKQIKELFPEKKIIVMMSGNYVQRGEPAVFSKSVRVRSALISGADLVFELPAVFSYSSSEYFARAGVLALSKTGIIDTLCFGAENDDIKILDQIADILLNEPDNYRIELKKHLTSGLSFPKARSLALKNTFPYENYHDIIDKPNNILAIEYIKAIKQYHLNITPHIIKRFGNDHNDMALQDNYSSASSIRSALKNAIQNNNRNYLLSVKNQIPQDIFEYLASEKYARPVFSDDFTSLLQYKLLSEKNHLNKYYEVSDYIENSIKNKDFFPYSYDELINILGGKHITNTRIKRCLLNILLNKNNDLVSHTINNGYLSYLQLLGFRKECSYLIKDIQKNCNLPIINKVAKTKDLLTDNAKDNFDHQIFIDNIYRQAYYNKYGEIIPSDYEQSVIIV